MYKKIFLGLILLISTNIFAQKPAISFTETTYDFGTIREEDKKVTHVFEFVNEGDADLVLKNVRASCGCTTPQWNREPIPPKEKGTITVTYRATGRPGPFSKSITVSSNADKKILKIKGIVTPRGEKVEKSFPKQLGDLRLKNSSISFGNIAKGDTRTITLTMANTSKKDITVRFVELPKCITAESKNITANGRGNISIKFDTKDIDEWGDIKDEIKFTTGTEIFSLSTTAHITENFTQEHKDNPPILKMANEIVAKEIKKGEEVTLAVRYENLGKVPLYIRDINPRGNFIEEKHSKKGLKPGKNGKFKIKIDTSNLAPKDYRQSLTIMTNDPNNTNKTFYLRFKVVE